MTDARILKPLTTEFILALRDHPLTFRAHASHGPIDMLGQGAALTVISGPSGSGRTTLLRALLEQRGGLLITSDMDVPAGHPLHRALPRDTLTITPGAAPSAARERLYVSAASLNAAAPATPRVQATLLNALEGPHAQVFAEQAVTAQIFADPVLFGALMRRVQSRAATLCFGDLTPTLIHATQTLSQDAHYLALHARHPDIPTGTRRVTPVTLNGETRPLTGLHSGPDDARVHIMTGPGELDLLMASCALHEQTGGLLLGSDLTDISTLSVPHEPGSFHRHEHLFVAPDLQDLSVKLNTALRSGHDFVYLSLPLGVMALSHSGPLEALRFSAATVVCAVLSPSQRHSTDFLQAVREQYGTPSFKSTQNCTLLS